MIEKNLFAPRIPGNLTLPYLTCQLARSTRRERDMGGGKAGRKGIVRISTTMMMMKMIFCSDFVASYRTMGKKIEIELVAFVIIIFLHTLLKVR